MASQFVVFLSLGSFLVLLECGTQTHCSSNKVKDFSSLHLKAITLQMKFCLSPGNLFCRWETAETTASLHANTVCNMYLPEHIAR